MSKPLSATQSGTRCQEFLTNCVTFIPSGLEATQSLWPAIRQAYALVHQAAHLLANPERCEDTTLKQE
jgi:hypothetical protein